jgi:hypothetical protein
MTRADDLYVEVAAGHYLFREGDAGAEMYIIESGRIAILRAARGAEPLAVLEPGDFLGEMAILEDQPRFASALAQSDTRLLRIERAAFAELIQRNVEIAIRIMRKLVVRQRRTELRVNELQNALQQLLDQPGRGVAADPAPAAVDLQGPGTVSVAQLAAPVPPVVPAAPVAAVSPVPAAPASVARPVLPGLGSLVLVHAPSGQQFPLDAECREFLVGRIDPVTGITPDINLGALDAERSMSRRHAKLLRQGSLLYLREEVGTANGTFRNGQRLATGVAVAVKPGDRLRFGTIEIELTAL